MTNVSTHPIAPTDARPKKSALRHVTTVVRILMGLLFAFASLAYFFDLVPPPKDIPQDLMDFSVALMKTGYFMPLLKCTELTVAVLLLANRFVPLALVVIAPVIVNIFMVHAKLAPSGLPTAIVLVLFEIYLAWAYRAAFRPLLMARHVPHA